MCGSSFIDEAFYDHIESKVRACSALLEAKSEGAIKKQLHHALEKFRNSIKPTFNGLLSEQSIYAIQFSGLPEDEKNGFFEDELRFER